MGWGGLSVHNFSSSIFRWNELIFYASDGDAIFYTLSAAMLLFSDQGHLDGPSQWTFPKRIYSFRLQERVWPFGKAAGVDEDD